jgi:hypothetical protein
VEASHTLDCHRMPTDAQLSALLDTTDEAP